MEQYCTINKETGEIISNDMNQTLQWIPQQQFNYNQQVLQMQLQMQMQAFDTCMRIMQKMFGC